MKKSQGERILAHLKAGKTISAKVAAQQYGCYRLGARIMELRDAGYKIDGNWVKRNEKAKAVFTYHLEVQKPPTAFGKGYLPFWANV